MCTARRHLTLDRHLRGLCLRHLNLIMLRLLNLIHVLVQLLGRQSGPIPPVSQPDLVGLSCISLLPPPPGLHLHVFLLWMGWGLPLPVI